MKKINIAIVCVTYNSYNSLSNYIKSISDSSEFCDLKETNIDVYVADNSIEKKNMSFDYPNISIILFPFDNIGYLKAAFRVLENIHYSKYDYICISNVDVLLDKSFFSVLVKKKYDQNIAWIAPSIYSFFEKKDRNPAVLKRFSLHKIKCLRLFLKYPILYRLYMLTIYKKKRRDISVNENHIARIYAGHGSFMIFTNSFFKVFDDFEFSPFLYGEELFFAEHIRLFDMKVYYDSSLLIYDLDHVSTGQMHYHVISKLKYQAIDFIIKKFYN
jgi:GT2 family glycosyltransferase